MRTPKGFLLHVYGMCWTPVLSIGVRWFFGRHRMIGKFIVQQYAYVRNPEWMIP